MSKDKKHIEQLIQDKLLQLEVRPPEHSWNAIEESLDASKAKPMLFYVRYVSAAAIVALLITVGIFQLKSPEGIPDVITLIEQDTIEIKEVNTAQDSVLKQLDLKEKIIIPQKSGIEISEDVALMPKPIKDELNVETAFASSIESTIESITGIYTTFTIALNNYVFDILPNTKQKMAEELYQDYLAKNEQLFKEDEGLKSRSGKFLSLGMGYGSAATFNFSGDTRYNDVASDPTSGLNESLYSVSNSNKSEEALNAFSFGLNINYQITKRLTIQSGLGYYKQGQSIKDLYVFAISGEHNSSFNDGIWSSKIAANTQNGNILIKESQFLLDNSSNLGTNEVFGISGMLYAFDLFQYFEYLEIPIIAAYTLTNNRLKFSVLAGINTGILIGNKVFVDNAPSVSIGSTEDMNTFVYKGIIGFSIDLPVFKQFHLFVSPSFRYQLNKTNKNVDAIPNCSYLDIKTGLSYWF